MIRFVKPNRRWRLANELQIEIAKLLLTDMEENKLTVVLVPQPRRYAGHGGDSGRKLRAAESHNPTWYSAMAQRRGFDKRGNRKRYGSLRRQVIKCLQRVADGWYDPIGYESELFEEAGKDLIERGMLYPELYDALNENGFFSGGKSEYEELIERFDDEQAQKTSENEVPNDGIPF